ncbi:histidine phosphatase family protein [Pontibacter sp. 172403-2]|uniref:SixA phosphatase family protein n=1 Tax=Pontibacter rufus TaxID=2791028 RepID=UPI0018AF8376|nr:histidine phosphatase family protein [Pontibacter sp. 172403-2]MBF9254115.1 histidine phosphatase family protein [Pontibacter sp. 172403-2]
MQKTVLLCRHAETADPYPLQPDFERALTPHGHQQALRTGQWIRDKFRKVDALLASPAQRASATARILASRLYFDEEQISYDPDLYNARETQLLRCLAALPEQVNTALLVAHNPGITRLARSLSEKYISYLEPATVVAISMDLASWQDIHTTTGTLSSDNIAENSRFEA